ncbi:PLK/PLK1 protein kinase [Phakopsora pachyrhizi]|uniref:PLK/PLK1 protein kinase n=1 Tax=Phakopsora pachyrhizi TaxID=170000 RepID=A0AAV0AER9_PHAPC|nr:PLK/PLK1 protein kinase [Phakopsora pachyrhizi]CAH7666116.1 PLK/PLK1 protein kinase [Phakopsora pachyrhizi]
MAQPITRTSSNPTTTTTTTTTSAKPTTAKPKPGKLSQQHKSPPRKIRKPIFDEDLLQEDPTETNSSASSSNGVYEDEDGRFIYLTRGCLLGEGGFARVYAMKDERTNRMGALKVVSKDQLKSSKNKSKLYAEIKLHRAMEHPHIVKFQSCFEDNQNVYLQMELCEHGSLLDLLRLRKRYSEPEARLLLFQLISACVYMHASSVIHRDLKPGNLFFATETSSLYGQDGRDDPEMERGLSVKVGDFGLAALVKFKGDRRKTICGTPNYIAPEILFDQTNGHSFEVDIWSVGVILYALLIGKPPFQTKDVNQIYRNIKANAYSFPSPSPISSSATDLISLILNQDPKQRPSLGAVVLHPWFSDGPFPFMIPMSALDLCPDFSGLSKLKSDRFRNDYIRKLGLDSAIQEEAIAISNLSNNNQRSLNASTAASDLDLLSREAGVENQRLDEIVEEDEDEVRAMARKMSKTNLRSDTLPQHDPVITKGKRALAASANRSERPHQQKRVVTATPVGVTLSDPIKASKERRRVEREAQSAVNPGSPISELLKSARKPLYVSPRQNLPSQMSSMAGAAGGGSQLFQQLISEKENERELRGENTGPSHLRQNSNQQQQEGLYEGNNNLGASTRSERKAKRNAVPQRLKDENDLGKQKARIASGMMDYGSAWSASQRHRYMDDEEIDNDLEETEKVSSTKNDLQRKLSKQPGRSSTLDQTGPSTTSQADSQRPNKTKSTTSSSILVNPTTALYDSCLQTLVSALSSKTKEDLMKLPFYNNKINDEDLVDDEGRNSPGVFIQSWVDYTHKYGTAYAMTDGSSGLYFNDGTTMVMAADRNHFDYIFNRSGSIYQRKNYTLKPKNYPIELERKTYLLEYFEDYMFTTLKRNVEWAYRDLSRTKDLDFVVKYYRMNNAIVFKMSNDLIQINFWDHQKLLLTMNAKKITLIEPELSLKTFYIGELFKEAYDLGLFQSKSSSSSSKRSNALTLTTSSTIISKGPSSKTLTKGRTKNVGEDGENQDDEEDDDAGKDPEWIARRNKVAFVLSKLEYAKSVLKSLVDRGNKEKASIDSSSTKNKQQQQ